MSDTPLAALVTLARHARRRALAALRRLGARPSRSAALAAVRRELARVEPLLARTLKDAQVLAWLAAGRETLRELPAGFGSDKNVTPVPSDPRPPLPQLPAAHGGSAAARVAPAADRTAPAATFRVAPPPALPPGPPFPDHPGDPPPAVRLPQVERAARHLATRLDYTPAEYAQLDADARRVAFTVATATTLEAVSGVRKALERDVREGGTLKQFRAAVDAALGAGALGRSQVESVYRTQTARAHAAGQQEVLASPLVASEFPYREYSATHDARVRPEHLALERLGLNGTAVYRADDPVWDRYYPPWGWQCFLPGTRVQGRFLIGMRFRYRGQAVEVVTRGDQRLRVTANHPVLTPQGFVPAKSLRQGDHILRYRGGVESGFGPNGGGERVVGVSRADEPRTAPPCQNVQGYPSSAEDVFRSMADVSGLSRLPVRPDDFHGDAVGGDGDVEVVGSTRKLLLDLDAAHSQLTGNFGLPPVDGGFAFVAGLRPLGDYLGRVLSAATRPPGGRTLLDDLGRVLSKFGPLQPLCIGPAAQLDARRQKSPLQHESINAGSLADTEHRLAGEVILDESLQVGHRRPVAADLHLGPQFDHFGLRPQRHARPQQYAPHASLTDAAFAAELRERFPAEIAADDVIEVRKFEWSGHVYDFQTEGGWLVADTILTSNCRCVIIPLTVEMAAEMGVREARTWLRTGVPPARPEWVKDPGFPLPKGWVPVGRRLTAAV